MMAKAIRALELHYPTIQYLIIKVITYKLRETTKLKLTTCSLLPAFES